MKTKIAQKMFSCGSKLLDKNCGILEMQIPFSNRMRHTRCSSEYTHSFKLHYFSVEVIGISILICDILTCGIFIIKIR